MKEQSKSSKIAILADPVDMQSAGIHVYTREMIQALQKIDAEKYIAVRDGRNTEINFKNELIHKEKGILGYRALRMFILLPRLLRKIKADLVIEPAHFGPFNLPKRVKRVTIIHDLTPILFPEWHRWHSQILQKIFLKRILKKASLVLTNSQNTLNDLRKVYPFTQEKSVCIYPGVDPFYICNKEEIVYKKEPFFLFTGTIEPRKNLITLLESFQQFKQETNTEFKLVIAGGKGWKSETFNKTLENHPYKADIELKGYVSKKELKDLYKTCTAFIYPSLYEGFGFPVAEAMACGAPCIVTNNSSLTEVGGEAVLFFESDNKMKLARHMVSIYQNSSLQAELILKGKQQAATFKWNEFAEKLDVSLLRFLT